MESDGGQGTGRPAEGTSLPTVPGVLAEGAACGDARRVTHGHDDAKETLVKENSAAVNSEKVV